MLQTANNYPSLVGCSSLNIHETHETYEFVFHKLTNLCWHPYSQIRGANKIHWLMYYRLQVSRPSHRLELAWRGCKFGGSKSNPRNDHNLRPQSLGSQTPKRSQTPKSLMYMERFFLTLWGPLWRQQNLRSHGDTDTETWPLNLNKQKWKCQIYKFTNVYISIWINE